MKPNMLKKKQYLIIFLISLILPTLACNLNLASDPTSQLSTLAPSSIEVNTEEDKTSLPKQHHPIPLRFKHPLLLLKNFLIGVDRPEPQSIFHQPQLRISIFCSHPAPLKRNWNDSIQISTSFSTQIANFPNTIVNLVQDLMGT